MIYGIGRNYASHAKELGNATPQGSPIVFFKPHAAYVESGAQVKLPAFSKDVHYEAELCFKFGSNLDVTEICIGNDLTARDKQREAQDSKSPWGLAKGFRQSAGFGNWVSAREFDLKELELRLLKNGVMVQHAFTKDMIFGVPSLAAYLKENFPVEPGDIVMTGTPEGVGALAPGDEIIAELLSGAGNHAGNRHVISRGQWKYT